MRLVPWLTLPLVSLFLLLSPALILSAADRVAASVVLLKLDNRYGFCSGFVISPRYVMTADHCMAAAASTSFATYIDDQPITEVWHDEGRDVAVVELPQPTVRPRLLVAKKPPGDLVITYGFPGGSDVIKSMIIVVVANGVPWGSNLGPWLIATPGEIPGMSGGPIVNQNGQVVSLNQQVMRSAQFPDPDFSLSRLIKPIYEASKQYWK